VRQVSEQGVRRPYQEPAVEKLDLKQTMQTLLSRARDLLPFVRPAPEPFVREEIPKVYERPQLRKLTREQASLILLGHGGIGDPGARDLIEIVYGERRAPQQQVQGSGPR
jgi:hypothetical protein